MTIVWADFLQNEDKDRLKRAAKLKVREMETDPDGRLCAFVEEGNRDQDVSFSFGEKGKTLKSHSCDCGDPSPFCLHKLALLQAWAAGKGTAEKKARNPRVKVDPLRQLIWETDPEKLRDWLYANLSDNKEWAYRFTFHFQERSRQWAPEDIAATTREIAKSIVKSKKKLEGGEVDTVIAAWKSAHDPIMESFVSQPADPGGWRNFQAILETVKEIALVWRTNSYVAERYLTDRVREVIQSMLGLQDPEARMAVLETYAQACLDFPESLRGLLFDPLDSLFGQLKMPEQVRMADILLAALSKPGKLTRNWRIALLGKLVVPLRQAGLFGRYMDHFSAFYSFEVQLSEYTLAGFCEEKNWGRAEVLAKKIIQDGAGYSTLRLAYQALKRVYAETNREADWPALAKEAVFVSFQWEDYQTALALLSPAEGKKFTDKLWRQVTAERHPDALAFRIRKYLEEEKWQVAGHSFEEKLSWPQAKPLLAIFFSRNPDMAVVALFSWNSRRTRYRKKKEDMVYLEEMLDWLQSQVEPETIQNALQTAVRNGEPSRYFLEGSLWDKAISRWNWSM